MDNAKSPALIGLVLGTILLTYTAPTSFAFDRVAHTGIATLACAGGAVIGLSRWLPREGGRPQEGNSYEAVPLNEAGHAHGSRDSSPNPSPQEDVTYPSSPRKLRIIFLALVAALVLRVEVFRHIVANIKCSSSMSWEPMLPLVFAIWDWWTVQRKRRRKSEEEDDADLSAYEAFEQAIANSQYTYLVAVVLTTIGELLALSWTRGPRSTFMCTAASTYHWLVPALQFVGSALDVAIVFCTTRLLLSRELHDSRSTAVRFAAVGKAMLASALLLTLLGVLYYPFQGNDRRWILTIPTEYIWTIVKLDFIITFTLISALVLASSAGVLTTLLLATSTSILTATTRSAWASGHPFPPQSLGFAFLGACLTILGLIIFVYYQSMDHRFNATTNNLFRRVPAMFYTLLLGLFAAWIMIFTASKFEVNFHPIDLLIFEAQQHHEAYVSQAATSHSLADAVVSYDERYDRLPPPNFDKWFEYARAHNSTIIDNFDGMYRNLLPFWFLRPGDIRDRTWELLASSENDIAGISIRDGRVSPMSGASDTQKWKPDGLIEMIGKFAEWLPDMDLAFNVNDEARVAVPWQEMSEIINIAAETIQALPQEDFFSAGRAETWRSADEENLEISPLQEIPRFYGWGNVGCRPNSAARTKLLWDTSKLCLACAYPHSLGAFFANWTTAADICHQPDLAELYTTPRAPKGTHELYPIFSWSKPLGFSDILYPSPSDYLAKQNDEIPDKPFPQKESTFFWRGETSHNPVAQRFSHLVNNIGATAPPQAILLPSEEGKLTYSNVPVHKLAGLLPTNVAESTDPIDLQQHWQYKYLLSLTSTNFLPFLRSRSLPFKAALTREWWDDRVTPWLHFVPLDVRGQGLWATLAYFHGLHSEEFGNGIDAHARDAERIAERGRKWAGEVLRREDMEVYMFRLLLEWGRLTDDRRDALGFEVKNITESASEMKGR